MTKYTITTNDGTVRIVRTRARFIQILANYGLMSPSLLHLPASDIAEQLNATHAGEISITVKDI